MNTIIFFNKISKTLFGNNISINQRKGIEYKLKAFGRYNITDNRWQAYMLATSYYETARTMQPIEERGKGAGRPYGKKYKQDGTVYAHPNCIYFGRGDVQLTWYENYERMGRLLGIPLLENPELALQPDISARIMIEGMTRGISNRGDFTGVSLENYFNSSKSDPVNARRVINGLDRAEMIAGYYEGFLRGLINAEGGLLRELHES